MNRLHVERVRDFNRLVAQRIGALEESYLKRGRPLAEARLLFETGAGGADVRALRRQLKLDSGYLSRLLRSLRAQGLVQVRGGTVDGRVRQVRLTARGRAERAIYDGLSDELAESLLSPLDPTQRERLVSAMSDVVRLIRVASVELRPEAPSAADARWCLDRYFRELSEQFELGCDPAQGDATSDEEMALPTGFFLVAWLDGCPVGCGGLKLRTGEIKRVWTAPSARGQGIARRIVRALEAKARDSGLRTVRLDTNSTLHEAQALYRKEGYREVAAFSDNPYAHHWFEKDL